MPLHEILKYPDQLITLRIASNSYRTIDLLEISTDVKDSASCTNSTSCLQSAKKLRHLDTSGIHNFFDSFSLADHYPSLESWRPAATFISNFLSNSLSSSSSSSQANRLFAVGSDEDGTKGGGKLFHLCEFTKVERNYCFLPRWFFDERVSVPQVC